MRKIAIIGTARSSVLDALNLPADWEIWTLNGAWEAYKHKATMHFELHSEEQLKKDGVEERYFQHLSTLGEKLTVLHKSSYWPQAQMYPLREVIAHFGDKYFNNTVSYMLALAIMQRPAEIAVYGVDMATDDFRGGGEYTYQRPNCEYYIAWARALGIKVFIPDASPLCKTSHLYSAELPTAAAAYMKGKYKEAMEMAARNEHDINVHTNALAARKADLQYYKGCMDTISNISKQLAFDMPVINRAINEQQQNNAEATAS